MNTLTKVSMALSVVLASAMAVQAQETVYKPTSVSLTGASTLFTADNLINGSGLTSPLNSGDLFASGINHRWGVDPSTDSWVSTDPGGYPSDWFAASGTIPAFVFDLGSDTVLNTAHFWAYGGGSGVNGTVQGNTARFIELRFNTAAQGGGAFSGTALSYELNHGPSGGAATGNILPSMDFAFGSDITARYVEMRVTDNWFVAPGDGTGLDVHGDFVRGGDRVGLGEVRFGMAVVPEPSSWAMLMLGLGGLLFFTRRSFRS